MQEWSAEVPRMGCDNYGLCCGLTSDINEGCKVRFHKNVNFSRDQVSSERKSDRSFGEGTLWRFDKPLCLDKSSNDLNWR